MRIYVIQIYDGEGSRVSELCSLIERRKNPASPGPAMVMRWLEHIAGEAWVEENRDRILISAKEVDLPCRHSM